MALQTEVTYTFLSLLGLLVMFWNVKPGGLVEIPTWRILVANFIFGVNI
jgi:hypothetical protein